MTYNPYEPYDNINNLQSADNTPEPEQTYEEISSSQQTDVQPDYTPDEYYQQHYAGENNQAENYAKYGESYYGNQQSYGYSDGYGNYNTQNIYSDRNAYGSQNSYYNNQTYTQPQKTAKPKKEKKPVTRGTIAALLAVTMVGSMILGVGGGFLASKLTSAPSQTSSNGLTVNKSEGSSSSYSSSTAALSTTEIVKKAADSVVEITTESVTTGSFSRQYIQQGAGSGVIISEDGYIITNYHVIEGASHITVTLRDQTEYTEVKVIGTYSDGDIALLKITPKETLTAATFGDSDKISIGDYAVVIGNPLGQLGGSVTDGIISALDREVTIDNETMNLLQTNAEISPGNSGGGLFNGNGELIGIVNAKSVSTEAEGIGFAIPINDVQDVLSDLKEYGYVKGQIDLGMSLTDISSTAQLWMYGANQTGVYVTSVNSGSNADKAGFRSGDIITKVNGTEVKSTTELNKIIKSLSVGDTVTFSVYRSGQSGTIKMKLQEYTKDTVSNKSDSSNSSGDNGDDYFDDFDPWSFFN